MRTDNEEEYKRCLNHAQSLVKEVENIRDKLESMDQDEADEFLYGFLQLLYGCWIGVEDHIGEWEPG